MLIQFNSRSQAAEVNKAFEKTEDLEYGGWKNKYKAPPPGYLGAIGQLQWHVPAMSNWTTWQFDAIKGFSASLEFLLRARSVQKVFWDFLAHAQNVNLVEFTGDAINALFYTILLIN